MRKLVWVPYAKSRKGLKLDYAISQGFLYLRLPVESILPKVSCPRQVFDPRIDSLLTRREREVYELLKNGRTNKEIAQELHVSERTAKFHVAAIFHKAGVSSRMAFVGTPISSVIQ